MWYGYCYLSQYIIEVLNLFIWYCFYGDSDNTPTNEKVSEEGDITPNETLNDTLDVKHTLKQVERLLIGKHIEKI
jgi:hypothetical protein